MKDKIMNNPKVTILCSNYNSSKWIDGYLHSINEQLMECFEIIFVDANSTDNSLETINGFNFRKGIIKKVLEKNTRIPIYEAWNLAINESECDYVMNVNTDDRIFPGSLLTLYHSFLKYKNYDIIYGKNFICADENHTQIGGLHDWPDHTHEILLQMSICGPFPMLKKSTIVDNGLFNPEYTISGDYEMWLRLSKRGFIFKKIDDIIGSYYNNPKGVSTDTSGFQEHVRQDTKLRNMYK